MKMDRNINPGGTGKYAIVNLRRLLAMEGSDDHKEARIALEALERVGVLEWGMVGEADEFFLIKLKDQHAMDALMAYHASAYRDDPEFADEVRQMALRSGPFHPLCKKPD